jgi:hypothetical protein
LFATEHEECIVADKEPSGPLTHKRWKGGMKFIVGAGIENKDFLPELPGDTPVFRTMLSVAARGVTIALASWRKTGAADGPMRVGVLRPTSAQCPDLPPKSGHRACLI